MGELQGGLLLGQVQQNVDPLLRGSAAEDQLLVFDDDVFIVPHLEGREGRPELGQLGQMAAQGLVSPLHLT